MSSRTYTLKVDVAEEDYRVLKRSGYKLVIAKMCNNQFNVVWTGGSFMARNTFQWTEHYQVFGCSSGLQDGALVKACTNAVPISFGQDVVLDADGILVAKDPLDTKASSALVKYKPSSRYFTVQNHYGPMRFAIAASINDVFRTTYVMDRPAVAGTVTFNPAEKVMVWFSQTLTTECMFFHADSNFITVDFTPEVKVVDGVEVLDHAVAREHTVHYKSFTPEDAGRGVWASGALYNHSCLIGDKYRFDTDAKHAVTGVKL